ncbi:MAG TPA: hypothetical protein VGB45_06155 [Abditibacterium sp.]|jgi:hypothetical protein
MKSKQLNLSFWLEVNEPIAFASTWKTWRVLVPGSEITPVPSDMGFRFGPSSDSRQFERFPTATYPINVLLNRATFYSDKRWDWIDWEDEFFTLLSVSSPVATGRVVTLRNPQNPVREFALNVEIQYPDWFLAQSVYGTPSGIFIEGNPYKFPGELFDTLLQWDYAPTSPNTGLPNGTANFRGGVQQFPTYYQQEVGPDGSNQQYRNADGSKNFYGIRPSFVENVSIKLSGMHIEVETEWETSENNYFTRGLELFGVGWSYEMQIFAHALSIQARGKFVLGGSNYLEDGGHFYDYTLFTPHRQHAFVLPHEASHFYLRRIYFTTDGRISVHGGLHKSIQGWGIEEFGARHLTLALPEQNTTIAPNGPRFEVGFSKRGPGIDSITEFENSCFAQILSFGDAEQTDKEDVSAPLGAPTSLIRTSRGLMIGSGLHLFQDEKGAANAMWWRREGSIALSGLTLNPLVKAAFSPQRSGDIYILPLDIGFKTGSKWFPGITQGANNFFLGVPVTKFCHRPRFVPYSIAMTCYEWVTPSETGTVHTAIYEVPTTIKLFFAKTDLPQQIEGVAANPSAVNIRDAYRLVATLDHLPFSPMPLLSAHEHGGSHLWMTNGIDGCWESDDLGDTWKAVENWTPAFESPLWPLDCAMLAQGPLSWGVLALDAGVFPPEVLFRRTDDGGETWADVLHVGELPEDAEIWGCALFSTHVCPRLSGRGSEIWIAHQDKIRWTSGNHGDSFDEVTQVENETTEENE